MRLGVLVLPTDPWPVAVARAQAVERLGYHHLWTYDHLSWRRYREQTWFAALPWLTGIAAATSRVRLGTMVASPNFRHPVTFAKEAMTLDHVSGGRLTLGIGAGGTGYDATVLGGQILSPGERATRLADFVAATDLLLRSPAATYRGTRYTVDEARMIPGCVQQPRLPLAVAAAGRRTIRLVARCADAWITTGDAATVRTHGDWLAAECAAAGRDPAEIDRIILVTNAHGRPLSSVDAFVDFVGRYAELGFTDVVFHDPRPGDPVWTEPPEIVDEIAAALLTG